MNEQDWKEVLVRFGLDAEKAFRPEQFRGAQAVDSVCGGKTTSLLLEAPTGIGKTLMYLGSLSTRHPDDVQAVVSISGKLLQKDIASSAKKLGMDPVILKGRANYLCCAACRHYLDTMPEDHPLRAELKTLCDYADAADSYELQEFLPLEKWSDAFLDFMRHHLTASSAYCRGGHEGKTIAYCFYNRLIERARKSSLLILNHHALFMLGTSDLFKNKVLIADEAHAMPEAASSVLTTSVSTGQLRALRNRAEECRDACRKPISKFCSMLDDCIEIFNEVESYGSSIFIPDEDFWKFFAHELDSLERMPFSPEVIGSCAPFQRSLLKELASSWLEIHDYLQSFRDPDSDNTNHVRYFEIVDDGQVILKCVPIETGPLLKEFWDQWSQTLGLSATLTLPGAPKGEEFDYFRKRCGFPKPTAEPLILNSPFDLEKQCRIFIPAINTDYDATAVQSPELFLKSRVHLAGSMIRAFNGRTLALYTASLRLAASAAVLKPLFREQVLAQGIDSADNDELAGEFVMEPHKALLGTRTFFQGFDAPGETLSCELLEKQPFCRRDDPVQEVQKLRAGDKWFELVVLPAMLMALRQAFGRLIRSESDHGVFILTDARFRVKNYRQAVEDALGGLPMEEFTSPADLLNKIPEGFLPFKLADISGFDDEFSGEWEKFQNTDLFRQITGEISLESVRKRLKINSLYDWQQKIIDNVRDNVPAQLVIYPAGSGKSLTYQIPALMRQGLTLVVSPLKSLMYDQVEALRKKGITQAAYYNSDLSELKRTDVMQRVSQGKIRLLYVSPERLHKSFIERILKISWKLSMLVIDEVHMISEAGSQWRPFYGELRNAWELFGKPQLLAVTATAGKNIKEEIQRQFDIPDCFVFEKSVVREQVKLSVNIVSGVSESQEVEDQKNYALKFIRRAGGKPVLIYCSQINYIHDLCKYLRGKGIPFGSIDMYYTGEDNYNNKIPSGNLEVIHEMFLKNRINVLIATSSYGMGIDKPDIWGVLFNNIPASLEELVQGWGRVCRDNNLLHRYSKSVHPPEISITFNPKDPKEQEEWKITKPFNKTLTAAQEICGSICLDWMMSDGLNFDSSYSCQSADSQTLDEIKLRACLLLGRFMRDREMLENGIFDWRTSEFRFEGIKEKPDPTQFGKWLENEKKKQIKQINDVRSFCLDKGCRNNFLQQYFTGASSDETCMYCDRCGYDLERHLDYVAKLSSSVSLELFVHGTFIRDNAAFLRYLESIPAEKLPGMIAYLDREHRESMREHTDAECAVRLLEIKLNGNDAATVVKLFFELAESNFTRLNENGIEEILYPFAEECGIQSPEVLWKLSSDLDSFVRKNQDSAAPQFVSSNLLQKCKFWQKAITELDSERQSAVQEWLKENAHVYLMELISDKPWLDCVCYLRQGLAWEGLFQDDGESDIWQILKKYLRYIIGLKENGEKEKRRYLRELVNTFASPEKEEWTMILNAPADYLKLAEADQECFGPEITWEREWFSTSALSRSRLERCQINMENIILSEADSAAEKMPIRSWNDLMPMLPCTALLCPEWKKLLETICRNGLKPRFAELIPKELAGLYNALPGGLKIFLKKKVIVLDKPQSSSRKNGKNSW